MARKPPTLAQLHKDGAFHLSPTRNPLLFGKSTTIVLALAVIVLLAIQHAMHR